MSKRDGKSVMNRSACWLTLHKKISGNFKILSKEHGGSIEQPVLEAQD